MVIQAYFEGIQQIIIKEIGKANTSVFVAVAWLTDTLVFNELCMKAKQGVRVELLLINDTINNDKAPFNHNDLALVGGKVHFVPAQLDGSIMHHKFCVIDNVTVITGSYNWSKKAQINDENIVVTEDAIELADQFIREFQSIKRRLVTGDDTNELIDFRVIMKRLEVIKSFVALEEEDEIANQIKKLREQTLPVEVKDILDKLVDKQFSIALLLLEQFIKDKQKVAIYDDAEIFGLQLEVKSLQMQLNAFENELLEAEKFVFEFSVRHTQELGELIIELLQLKKEMASTDEEKVEAEEDEKSYKEGYEVNKDIVIPKLDEVDQRLLTKMYREASLLCHPDKFTNETPEKQKQAEEMFKELADAYSCNDTTRVTTLLNSLRKGILTADPKNVLQKKDLLKVRIEEIKYKIDETIERVTNIKKSETYLTASNNKNWDEYFVSSRVKLQNQIDALKQSQA